MYKTKAFRMIYSFSVLFFLIGCADRGQFGVGAISSTAPTNSAPPGEQSPTGSQSDVNACYGQICFKTLSLSALIDSLGDYKYLNEIDYPNTKVRGQYAAPARFIDLKDIDASEAISKNFILNDVMDFSHGRYGLFSPAVLVIMQKMRDELGVPMIVNSGYRSPGHNGQTDGSAQWSRHMYGDGIDFTLNKAVADYSMLQKLCLKYSASFTLIYPAHIHCDWRLLTLDPVFYGTQVTTQSRQKTATHVAQEIAAGSQIQIVGETKYSVQFDVHLPTAEETDEEERAIHHWIVILPDKSQVISEQLILEIPKMSGRYLIRVMVGGSIEVSTSIDL